MVIDVILPSETIMPNGQRYEEGSKVIYNYIPVERSLCPTVEEVKAIVNYYPYGHRHRLCFLIMATAGLRSSEIVGLRLDGFVDKRFTEIRYRVSKFKTKTYVSGTKVINYKTRIAVLPDWLGKELEYYVKHNFHMFEDGRLFPFSTESLRRYFNKIRDKAHRGKLLDPVLCRAMLDTTVESVSYGIVKNKQYRLSLHSFRRFYLTYIYHAVYDRDVARVQRDIGHDLKETTFMYVYHPENIGITSDLVDRSRSFSVLVDDSGQKRMNDF